MHISNFETVPWKISIFDTAGKFDTTLRRLTFRFVIKDNYNNAVRLFSTCWERGHWKKLQLVLVCWYWYCEKVTLRINDTWQRGVGVVTSSKGPRVRLEPCVAATRLRALPSELLRHLYRLIFSCFCFVLGINDSGERQVIVESDSQAETRWFLVACQTKASRPGNLTRQSTLNGVFKTATDKPYIMFLHWTVSYNSQTEWCWRICINVHFDWLKIKAITYWKN